MRIERLAPGLTAGRSTALPDQRKLSTLKSIWVPSPIFTIRITREEGQGRAAYACAFEILFKFTPAPLLQKPRLQSPDRQTRQLGAAWGMKRAVWFRADV